MALLISVFLLSVAALAYTYVLYPVLMYLLAQTRQTTVPPPEGPENDPPNVTVVIAACDAEALIEGRLKNLLASDYPMDKLDIVVVSDGSQDQTAETAQGVCSDRVTVLEKANREGKMTALNLGIPVATGEIVVLTDTRQQFDAAAIRQLLAHFSDPAVGAVSGNLDIAKSATGSAAGVDAYWKLEKFLRLQESRFASAVGCTGAIYAIRKSLFAPLPADTILDDVIIPMSIAVQGYRVLFEPNAMAWDPQPLRPENERHRKRRTIAGSVQALCRYPAWLLPWRNPIWWQLISHKYLRLLGPFLLLIALGTNAVLALLHPVFVLAMGVQIACYVLAFFGFLFPAISWKPVSLCAGFLFLNARIIPGIISYMRGDYAKGWGRSERGLAGK